MSRKSGGFLSRLIQHLIDFPSKNPEVDPMPSATDNLLSEWPNLENIPACDEGMKLAQTFLEAAGECVNRLGIGRTSGTRSVLLSALNAMEMHGDSCKKCNEA
jgi:hypothetical protein